MRLAAVVCLGLKLTAWIGTFTIFSLWLEVNSAADRVIQRAVNWVSWVTWRTVESLLT